MTLLEKLEDLLVQATTEHSHNYTASVLQETITYLKEEKHRIAMASVLGGLKVLTSDYVEKGHVIVSSDDFPPISHK